MTNREYMDSGEWCPKCEPWPDPVLTPLGHRAWRRARPWLTWTAIVVAFAMGCCAGALR